MAPFSPVSSNKLYIQIHNQIREAILRGDFKPGDKLPSEKELCQMFSVSRVPVREALCALELNGLVESNQGQGVYVREVNSVTNDWISETDPQDIIQARMFLEPELARLAALNIGEAEKVRMRDIIEKFRAEAEAGDYSEVTDREFHMCIARAGGNHMYLVLCDMIWKAMEQRMWSLILSRTVTAEQHRRHHYEEHREIAEAILAGNAERAYETMKLHMENLDRRFWD